MGLDIRTIALFVGILSAVQALGIFLFSKMVGSQPGVNQYALGNAGFSLGFVLLLLRGIIPDFFSIVIANTAISLAGYIVFVGACDFTHQDVDRRSFLLIPGVLFFLFLNYTYAERNIAVRTMLASATSAFFSFACSYILFRFSERELRQSSWFTATILSFYGSFLAIRAILAVVFPGPEDVFVSTDIQVLSFLLMAFCGLLWSIGFAMMMAQRLILQTRHVAVTDYLTGIRNRMAGQAVLEGEIGAIAKNQRPFSILLIDVDAFKTVNDVYGHAAGDIALRRIAAVLKASIRAQDTLSRWGGDEFLIVLPGAARQEALAVAERARKRIAETRITFQEWRIKCTISIGVAGNWEQTLDVDELLAQADRCMYEAKQNGKNRVVIFGQSGWVTAPVESWNDIND